MFKAEVRSGIQTSGPARETRKGRWRVKVDARRLRVKEPSVGAVSSPGQRPDASCEVVQGCTAAPCSACGCEELTRLAWPLAGVRLHILELAPACSCMALSNVR